jgi:uncharacterized protein (UPF0332 family)
MSDGRLIKCFKGTRELPKRLLKVSPSISTAEEHISKSESNILAMELMNENKLFDWTIVCGYYAMYHATMASLWLIGLDARTHECALLAFESFYIKRGRIPKEYLDYLKRAERLSSKYGDTLKKVKSMRLSASYGLAEVKSQESSLVRSNAKEFVEEIKRLVYAKKGIEFI